MTHEAPTLHAWVRKYQSPVLSPLQTFPLMMALELSMATVLEHIAPEPPLPHPPNTFDSQASASLLQPTDNVFSINVVSKASLFVSFLLMFSLYKYQVH